MTINTYTAPIYLLDEVDELISDKYLNSPVILDILKEYRTDLELIHNITRKIADYEAGKISIKDLVGDFNYYRSGKSMNLLGDVV